MIKLSIKGTKTEEKVQNLELGLVIEDDIVKVVNYDENGEINYYLLGIYPDGRFARYEGVDNEIGLQLNEVGQIIERTE